MTGNDDVVGVDPRTLALLDALTERVDVLEHRLSDYMALKKGVHDLVAFHNKQQAALREMQNRELMKQANGRIGGPGGIITP